ncbi:hypothetical protein ACTJKC_02405 [Pedobacter sp. 22226]|uniref:hypothetical protein n=1 Tax=Pedobacter sp. 22226 TaxID=3453894 RepID=UPI003F862D72
MENKGGFFPRSIPDYIQSDTFALPEHSQIRLSPPVPQLSGAAPEPEGPCTP